jgi:cytochrome P450
MPDTVGPLPNHFELSGIAPKMQWAHAPNGTGFWLVSDYKMAREVLADPNFSRSEAAGQKAPKISSYNASPSAIISLEGAEHTRIRQLVAPAFTERKVAKMEPFVVQSVADLLDGLAGQPRPVDFVKHVAAPLPFGLLCHLLGVPPADRGVFGSWVNVLFRLEGDIAASREHSVSLARYMTRLVAEKRREPAGDLISNLIERAERMADRVTNRELVTLCLSLLMAGYDSTVDQITLCVLKVLLDKPLMNMLRDHPGRVPDVTEELLRLNPAPYMTFPRMALKDTVIGATAIRSGELVVVFIMGSNRDPGAFKQVDEIMLDQGLPAHLTFGHGLHRCLGAPLARQQLTVLLEALPRRFPNMHITDDLRSLRWKTGMATRGLSYLHVSW